MAEEKEKTAEQEKAEEPKPPKKGPLAILTNRFVLIGLILVAQLAIAIFTANMIISSTIKKQEEAAKPAPKPGETIMVPLENILVNLMTTKNELCYLKLSIGLEVASAEVQKEVETSAPILRDIVISVLSSKRVTDFDTAEERDALKADLYKRFCAVLPDKSLVQIYFSDFVMQ